MGLSALAKRSASVLWLEPHRIKAGAHQRPLDGWPDEDQLAQALSALPQGPTLWIVEDLYAPSVLLRDIVEVPPGPEAQEAFFRWRFNQAMAQEGNFAVQSLQVDPGVWLLAGLPAETRDAWMALALRLGRPIHGLIPRWLWLYNRLAPAREKPGLLLSLGPAGAGRFTGTLAAWGRNLTLLRQWTEPMALEGWLQERVLPTTAFLQREGRGAQEILVWGAPNWPDLGAAAGLAVQVIQPEIPEVEAV